MNQHPKLPLRITLLLWLVLILTAWNIVRFATSLGWRDTLVTYAVRPGPFYIGLTGAIWTILGCVLLLGFTRGANWSRVSILVSGIAYFIWFWIDRLFVQPLLRANWPFDLLITVVILGFTIAVALDPDNQNYFLKRDL